MIHLLSSGKLCLSINEKTKLNKNIPKIVRSLIVYMVLQAHSNTNFAYRFWAILRNYSRHILLQQNEVKAESPDDMTVIINFYIDLEYLLKIPTKWRKLKGELI